MVQEVILEMLVREKIKEDTLLIALAKLGGKLTIIRDKLEKIIIFIWIV